MSEFIAYLEEVFREFGRVRSRRMSFYLAAEEALEDPSEMRKWAQLAYDAALRSAK